MPKQPRRVKQFTAYKNDKAMTSDVVAIPEQTEDDVLTDISPGASVVGHGALIIGFEQASKFAISDINGNHVGYLAEEDGGFGKAIQRQLLRTRRPFKAIVWDKDGNVVMKIDRAFSIINSKIYIHDHEDRLIGEVHQVWHPWRRRYALFVDKVQFAKVDAGFLMWDFDIVDEDSELIGNVSRNFMGFAREIFTDTGHYVLRMDDVEGGAARPMSLDERAVTLALAVTLDVDYFSRHSHGGGGLFHMLPFYGLFGGDYE